MIDNVTIRAMKDYLDTHERIEEDKKLSNRMYIINTDPNAPLCIRCRFCLQCGFLFECPIFEDVGLDSLVYYRRKDHKPKTYNDVPMKESECAVFESLLPLMKETVEGILSEDE